MQSHRGKGKRLMEHVRKLRDLIILEYSMFGSIVVPFVYIWEIRISTLILTNVDQIEILFLMI